MRRWTRMLRHRIKKNPLCSIASDPINPFLIATSRGCRRVVESRYSRFHGTLLTVGVSEHGCAFGHVGLIEEHSPDSEPEAEYDHQGGGESQRRRERQLLPPGCEWRHWLADWARLRCVCCLVGRRRNVFSQRLGVSHLLPTLRSRQK